MAKKRRRLNKDMEGDISSAKRKVELITAIINDIDDEVIQNEYKQEFDKIRYALTFLSTLYDSEGFNESTENALNHYKALLLKFENEYEI